MLVLTRSTLARSALAAGAAGLLAGGPAAATAPAAPTVTRSSFGELATGTAIERYTLRNGRRMSVSIITYGATIRRCGCPTAGDAPATSRSGSATWRDT